MSVTDTPNDTILLILNSYLKVTCSESVCLWFPKDLANHWTYTVIIYCVASYRSWEGL